MIWFSKFILWTTSKTKDNPMRDPHWSDLWWPCISQSIMAENKACPRRLEVFQVTTVFGSCMQMNYNSTEKLPTIGKTFTALKRRSMSLFVAHVFPAENSKMWIRTGGGCSTPCLLRNTEQPFRAEMISQPIITRVCGVYPKVSLL